MADTSRPLHETGDVSGRLVAYTMVAVAAFVVISAFGLWLLFETVWQPAPGAPSPFANEKAATLTRQPALQQAPAADLRVLNRRLQQRLDGVGWLDRDASVVHMPIDRAMTLLVQRGLPVRSLAPSKGRTPPQQSHEDTMPGASQRNQDEP